MVVDDHRVVTRSLQAYLESFDDLKVVGVASIQGDAYDRALAESVIGLFKTAVIRRKGPWRSVEAAEVATLA